MERDAHNPRFRREQIQALSATPSNLRPAACRGPSRSGMVRRMRRLLIMFVSWLLIIGHLGATLSLQGSCLPAWPPISPHFPQFGTQTAKNEAVGLYYLRARYMNAANGRFWNADSYEGAEDDPISLHKYIFANDNPISGIDPSGYATLVEIQTSTAIESSWASKVAERVGSLYARSAANRRWLIWRVELKSGVPWFQHTFIWAQDVRTKRAIGYHVLADVKDMVLSRRLRTFVPGLFAVFPQPQVERIGPLRLPVASQIPVGYLSNTQFVVWNALSISTIAAEFMENIYVAGYPYRIPDCNCITWTDAAARNAAVLSAIPF